MSIHSYKGGGKLNRKSCIHSVCGMLVYAFEIEILEIL